MFHRRVSTFLSLNASLLNEAVFDIVPFSPVSPASYDSCNLLLDLMWNQTSWFDVKSECECISTGPLSMNLNWIRWCSIQFVETHGVGRCESRWIAWYEFNNGYILETGRVMRLGFKMFLTIWHLLLLKNVIFVYTGETQLVCSCTGSRVWQTSYFSIFTIPPSIFQQEIDFFSSVFFLAVLWEKGWYYWAGKNWHSNFQESWRF